MILWPLFGLSFSVAFCLRGVERLEFLSSSKGGFRNRILAQSPQQSFALLYLLGFHFRLHLEEKGLVSKTVALFRRLAFHMVVC